MNMATSRYDNEYTVLRAIGLKTKASGDREICEEIP